MFKINILQHSLSLDRWVIRSEVLVLFDILFEGEELFLQFISQTRERVPNVVRELLIEDPLQVGGAEPVREMPVGRMAEMYVKL